MKFFVTVGSITFFTINFNHLLHMVIATVLLLQINIGNYSFMGIRYTISYMKGMVT